MCVCVFVNSLLFVRHFLKTTGVVFPVEVDELTLQVIMEMYEEFELKAG